MQPVIKWTGSKRSQAKQIVSFMPKDYNVYYEPFIGGGSVLYEVSPKQGVCSDICEPLIELWNMIKFFPIELYETYKNDWNLFFYDENYYYEVRKRFNKNGEFNSAVHHKRNGINPETLKQILLDWSDKIKNVSFLYDDYKQILEYVKSDDFVYLDPPYFHTVGIYYGGIDYDEFIDFLRELNKMNVRYILSYDGIRGTDDKRVDLPNDIYKQHKLLLSGDSTFSKMKGEKKTVYESIYMNY